MLTISFRYVIRIVEQSTRALNVCDSTELELDTVKKIELLMVETVSTTDRFRKNRHVLSLTSARRKLIA